MAEQPVQRRLAAILAADVVGYSRLMEVDESGTLVVLKARRKEVLEPLVGKHCGRIFKITGDGVLVDFASAVNAVQCALELQAGMAAANENQPADRQVVLRIGVNLGDVMVEGGDLYGEGVNLAARLESLANPGGICISGDVYRHVRSKLHLDFQDLGEQKVKNIAEPVRAYRIQTNDAGPGVVEAPRAERPAPALPKKASIAVLPFTNMSGDPEQEYFADGLTEDLITDLSKVAGLLVISRHSSFTYKGRSADIRSVARDLGVQFIVEGSVRRAAARVRINVQLVDAKDGTHLWADRFDRDLSDFFILQDEVVGRVVSALSGLLPSVRLAKRQRATSIDAYDLFVRARVMVNQSDDNNKAARSMLERAIELDPEFADAHACLALSHLHGRVYWGEASDPNGSLALAAAQRAVALDPGNADAHAVLGNVLIYRGRLVEGTAEMMTALQIDPNNADCWGYLAEAKGWEGNAVEGIDYIGNALRLNPHPPGWYYWCLGFVKYAAGQYEEAIQALRHEATHRSESQRILAASLVQLGRLEEAKLEAAQFLAAHPHFSIENWASTQPFQRDADRQHFIDGYLKAGLPM